MKLQRRHFLSLTAAAALALVSAPVAAQQLSLGEISAYFNAMQSAQSGFTQINPDDTISTGQIVIKRPGRMRFEYAAPDNSMMIAAGGQLAIFDPRSNEGPMQYPLNQTPLSILLERTVDLGRRGMVRGHRSDGTTTTVVAQDPDRPEYGTIELIFTANPVALRQWVVTDQSGGKTTVILNDLRAVASIPERRFNIIAEMDNWRR